MANTVTLTGKFVAADGAGSTALIRVSWRYPYRATNVTLATDVRERALDAQGAFSITVPLPAGLTVDPILRVDYLPRSGLADIQHYPIPRSSSGTVDLSSLTPLNPVDVGGTPTPASVFGAAPFATSPFGGTQ